MNNSQIICQEAIASGFYTEDEVNELLSVGKLPEMHTFAVWKAVYGMVPMRNQHGWECRLWRRKNKNQDDSEASDSETDEGAQTRDFYLTKSFLFHISQMQKLDNNLNTKDKEQ